MSKRPKALKLFILSTAVAVSGVVAADNPTQAAASSNATQLVTKAEKLAGALKWEVSYEYRKVSKPAAAADYPNMTLFNQTKAALSAAQKAVAATKGNEKTVLQARLNQNVKVYVDRAVKYIDAVTSGKKILAKAAVLDNKIRANIIDDSTVAAYHDMSNEIKKRSSIISRVYGKTTREALFAAYVNRALAVKQTALYPVSIKIELGRLYAAIQQKDKTKILYCADRINKFFTDGVSLKLLDSNSLIYKQLDSEYKNALKSCADILVASAKAKLTFSLIANGNSSADNVTSNLTLPASDIGVVITWSSDKPSVVSTTGEVHRSPLLDEKVVLTAVIKSTEAPLVTDTVTIPITVKRQVAAAPLLQGVTGIVQGILGGTTKIITLPFLPQGAVRYEYKISIDNNPVPTPQVGDVYGGTTYTAGNEIPAENGKHIGIAAVDTNGRVIQFCDIVASSNPAATPAEKVAVAKAKLSFSYIANGNTDANNVTQDLKLPIGDTGVIITWTSDNPMIVSNTGEVHQSLLSDVHVVLTAVITSTENSATNGTVVFPLTVKRQQLIPPILSGVEGTVGSLLGRVSLTNLPALPAGADHFEYILSELPITAPYVGDVLSNGIPYVPGTDILVGNNKYIGVAAVDALGKVVSFSNLSIVPQLLPI